MRTIFLVRNILILGICHAFFSCSKNEVLEIDSESQSIVDHVIADQEFMAVPAIIYQHLSKNTSAGGAGNSIRNCAPFTYEGGDTLMFSEPARYSLDLKVTTCSLNDGKDRSGKLHVSMSGFLNDLGCRTVVKFQDYAAAGWRYDCDSMVLISTGVSGAYNAYKVDVYNGRASQEEASIRYGCNRQVAVYSDLKAPGKKALTSFFGTSKGINRAGLAFDTEVKTDITRLNDCAFFNSGTLIIIPSGYKARLIDFGAGECDDLGSFTVNENTVAFKLK